MPTEFMHAMYDQGGGAGLRDFWDRWCTNPMFAGGFIWVFCDEAPKRSDKGGILDSDKSNAPDGVVGPRREKERKLLCYPRTMVAHPVKTPADYRPL